MARRAVVSLDALGPVASMDGRQLWETQDPGDYISYLCRDPGIVGLLWREVKPMIRWASSTRRGINALTAHQTLVLECYLLGHSDIEIAERLHVSRQAVWESRSEALRKIHRYRPRTRGLLTVMIEEMGWSQVREHLADLADERER
jgi:predicted DNA-binding protein YlxM (UPF0122 family)